MMVTFISQCEKNALKKTRRVLDAFANRIGDNTWQTVITQEGLNTVRKMLRQTASKSTAVSCHWIRSRSRSQFLWVVGNKSRFNEQGIVPVNYTNTLELIMDEILIMTNKIYANTKQQSLDQHLFAVGYLANRIIQQFVPDDSKLSKAVFIAGALHDIGKIDPAFQSWLDRELKKKKQPDVPDEGQHIYETGRFSFEKHPRHNEISLLLFFLLNQEKNINPQNKDRIKHALYWHHSKPIRKVDFKNLDTVYNKFKNNIGNDKLTDTFHAVAAVVGQLNVISENYFSDDPLLIEATHTKTTEDQLYELSKEILPSYKCYSLKEKVNDYLINIRENAKNNLARTAIITADRLVSALSNEALATNIEEKTLHLLLNQALIKERGLKSHILRCLEGFEQNYPNSHRNKQQSIVAKKLTYVEHIAVLNGAAGCGKTKIALQWAAESNAKKIIWVCPRVQVCLGLVKDLTGEEYLPNAKIEINTGEFKSIYQFGKKEETPENKEFSGDIVLTTIDQIVNTITTYTNITGLVQYMNSHVVFDEYHEYINMPAFNLLFVELVQCKKLQGKKAKTLLVSATPNYYFVENLIGIDQEDIIGIENFNRSKYRIHFTSFDEAKQDESNPLYKTQPDNTFVISNTAVTAQKSFIDNQKNENALLLHSKFTKPDKEIMFEKVFDTFKQKGTKEYNILRSGPVVQASLNISCDQMVTEVTNAENWLQRLGRLDRFGLNTKENLYITVVPEVLITGRGSSKILRFLNNMHCRESAKAWYEFLRDSLPAESITITKIYQLYKEFYENETHRISIEQDLIKALKKSVEVINNKLMDPVSLPRNKMSKDNKIKIKKHSLRGDNRFVQMAIINIRDRTDIEYSNQYAYPETDTESNLTASVEVICGYGDSRQNLLAFMVKKHHNIKGTKKSYNDRILINGALSPETPIYLSYVPDDLEKVAAQAHPNAIYYAIGSKQPIGAISTNQLMNKDD